MPNPSDGAISMDVLYGMRSVDDGKAVESIRRIANNPCMLAARELIEILEVENRSEPVKAAAREALAAIIAKAQGGEAERIALTALACQKENAGKIFDIVAEKHAELPSLEIRAIIVKSEKVGPEAKVKLIRDSNPSNADHLITAIYLSRSPDRFNILWELAREGTENEEIRVKAMGELARIGSGDDNLLMLFEPALDSGSAKIRYQAAACLEMIMTDETALKIEGILAEHLKGEKEKIVQMSIIEWLSENGTHCVSHGALLEAAASDRDVAKAAAKAAKRLADRLKIRPPVAQSGFFGFFRKKSSPGESGQDEGIGEDIRREIRLLRGREGREQTEAAYALAAVAQTTNKAAELVAIETNLRGLPQFTRIHQLVKERMRATGIETDSTAPIGRISKPRHTPPAPPGYCPQRISRGSGAPARPTPPASFVSTDPRKPPQPK